MKKVFEIFSFASTASTIIFIVSFLVSTMFNNYHGNQQYSIRLTDVVSNGIQSFHWIRWRRRAGKNRNTCVNVKLLKAFWKIKETYITKYTKLYYYLYDAYALHFEFSFMFFFLRLTAFLFQIHPVYILNNVQLKKLMT